MSDLLAARSQMAVSLAFHIVFAVIGIAMPLLMVVAEWRWQRSRDPIYLDLAKRWARGTAILFAVGAVSGTVLSFELGLLWPRFMEAAGPIIGMPFSLEGFAFFTEAIFLGIYLYGWESPASSRQCCSGWPWERWRREQSGKLDEAASMPVTSRPGSHRSLSRWDCSRSPVLRFSPRST